MNYKDRINGKQRKCPKCGSKSLYIPVSVMAKIKYNGNPNRVYGIDPSVIDNTFNDGVTCEKCGWEGKDKDLLQC